MTYLSSFMILNNDNVLLNEECYIRKNNDWVLNEIIDKDKFIGYVSYKNKRYQFSHYFRWKFIMKKMKWKGMQIYEIFSSNGPMTQMWADDQLKVLIDDSMRCNFWKSLLWRVIT
uniref:Uncharacterized protein n=1 Tax=Rhizophagus irregularis (strain DAOM 181602 / DAOM 197198 / MUCL 43194) TaxID=747089 RepID=U9UQP1_RHIID